MTEAFKQKSSNATETRSKALEAETRVIKAQLRRAKTQKQKRTGMPTQAAIAAASALGKLSLSEASTRSASTHRGSDIPCCLLDPRQHTFVGLWDGISAVALIFTALVTPYEVAFIPAARVGSEPLFIINRVVDGIFLLDVVFHFFLVYHEEATPERAARSAATPISI